MRNEMANVDGGRCGGYKVEAGGYGWAEGTRVADMGEG